MARCRECNSKISRSMDYCPQCGVRDPAGYNIQAPAVNQERRKRRNFLVPFLGVAAIFAIIIFYVAGPAQNKQNEAGATAQKPNDDPEKAELVKRMRDAIMARHHGVMPEKSSEADTNVMLEVSKKWLAEKQKRKLDAMKVKPPPSNGYVEIEWAKEHIKPALRDPNSAVFGDTFYVNDRKSETGYYLPAVCGTVNARNGFGGMTGQKRFVYLIFPNESRLALEGSVPDATLVQFWNQFCAGSHD